MPRFLFIGLAVLSSVCLVIAILRRDALLGIEAAVATAVAWMLYRLRGERVEPLEVLEIPEPAAIVSVSEPLIAPVVAVYENLCTEPAVVESLSEDVRREEIAALAAAELEERRAADSVRVAATRTEIVHAQAEIEHVSTILDNAMATLIASFTDLATKAREQQHVTTALTSRRFSEGDASAGGVEALLDRIEATYTAMRAYIESSESKHGLSQTAGALATRLATIIGVLSEAADLGERTKMLALNASIEAARAGSAGRGFAVIATEVRKLSDKSYEFHAQVRALLAELRTDIGAIENEMIELSKVDVSFISQSRETIGALATEIRAIDRATTVASSTLESMTRTIESDVHAAVINLQFHDLASQLLTTALNRLGSLASALESGSLDDVPAEVSPIHSITETALTAGTVELF